MVERRTCLIVYTFMDLCALVCFEGKVNYQKKGFAASSGKCDSEMGQAIRLLAENFLVAIMMDQTNLVTTKDLHSESRSTSFRGCSAIF
jgi:hypothetical protein